MPPVVAVKLDAHNCSVSAVTSVLPDNLPKKVFRVPNSTG